MSHIIELTDDQYETLSHAAEERGETLEALVAAFIYQLRDDPVFPHAFATDEWFHHLGASEEQITEAKRIARERGDANT